jgi:hypothetical protein
MTAGKALQLRFQWSLWISARLMPLRIHGLGLERLISLYEPAQKLGFIGLTPAYIINAVREVTHHPWLMRNRRCLRHGLLAYHYLLRAGFQPRLCFGVDRRSVGESRLSAHCWVALEGKDLLNPPESTMLVIYSYAHGDRIEPDKLPARILDARPT